MRKKARLTLVKSLTGSYPVDLAHSLVETRLMSPSSLEALALASASVGSPTKQTSYLNVQLRSHLRTHSEFQDSNVSTSVFLCLSGFIVVFFKGIHHHWPAFWVFFFRLYFISTGSLTYMYVNQVADLCPWNRSFRECKPTQECQVLWNSSQYSDSEPTLQPYTCF